MVWCEDNDVDFLFGVAKNSRLAKEIEDELALAKALYQCSGKAFRVFKELCYKTLKTWRWSRRVIGKAEHLVKGANPRFIVTSLKPDEYNAQELYEKVYCARGDMENRIKEQQLMLFAARTSTLKDSEQSGTALFFFSSLCAYASLCVVLVLPVLKWQKLHAQFD